jgi:predicted DNA-binding transcriptional regulator YafY
MRNLQVIRQWELLQALQSGPKALSELAAAHNVAGRTIRRDLEALSIVGFPVYTERHSDGITRWHLLRNTAPGRRAA